MCIQRGGRDKYHVWSIQRGGRDKYHVWSIQGPTKTEVLQQTGQLF